MPHISEEEITIFSKHILDISGIYLDKSKGYLLESRLKDLMDECGAASYNTLLNQIKADSTKKLEKKLIDAISTNETFFFRDNIPFDLLRNKIIPDLIDRRRARHTSGSIPIRIWSAACSSGQETYSIAITLLEMLSGTGSYNISIMGTDISGKAVAQASYGKYSRFEVERGLPTQVRQKYFVQSANSWRIKDEVRALATFDKLNLMQPFPPSIGPFDIVFCRNVAIYFQNHDKINLFKKIARIINPGGALIVGGSENLTHFAPDFVSQHYLKGIFYALKKDLKEKHETRPIKIQSIRKPVKKRPHSRRKTVYDNKLSKTKTRTPIEKKPIQEEKPKPDVPIQHKVPIKITLPPIESQNIEEEKEQTSLLTSIQDKSKQGRSLFDKTKKSDDSKGSLLEKIAHNIESDDKTEE